MYRFQTSNSVFAKHLGLGEISKLTSGSGRPLRGGRGSRGRSVPTSGSNSLTPTSHDRMKRKRDFQEPGPGQLSLFILNSLFSVRWVSTVNFLYGGVISNISEIGDWAAEVEMSMSLQQLNLDPSNNNNNVTNKASESTTALNAANNNNNNATDSTPVNVAATDAAAVNGSESTAENADEKSASAKHVCRISFIAYFIFVLFSAIFNIFKTCSFDFSSGRRTGWRSQV